jgi:hypothetical protein
MIYIYKNDTADSLFKLGKTELKLKNREITELTEEMFTLLKTTYKFVMDKAINTPDNPRGVFFISTDRKELERRFCIVASKVEVVLSKIREEAKEEIKPVENQNNQNKKQNRRNKKQVETIELQPTETREEQPIQPAKTTEPQPTLEDSQ